MLLKKLKKSMKIALVIDAWEPIIGGGQENVLEISKRIVKTDHSIDIFTRKLPGFTQDYTKKNINIFRSGPTTNFFNPLGRILSIFSITARLIKEHQKNHYDLIHAHVFLGAFPAKVFSFLTRIPIVLTVHGTNLTDTHSKGLSSWLEKKICFEWKYQQVITVGQGYLKYPHTSPVTVIPNGIDLSEFEHSSPPNRTNKINFLFVGRFEWTKGIEHLLLAIKDIKENYPLIYKKIIFNLVGYGYNELKYQKLVAKYQISDVVKFLGKKTGHNLLKEFQSNNIFILPSITEGDSIVVKKAWASKLPVIVTKSNGPEFYVDDKINGWITDHQSLSKTIILAANTKSEVLIKMGNNGYQKVIKNYQWDKIAKLTLSVYKKAISPSTN